MNNGTFEGGKTIVLGADTNNVLLPIETSKFQNFTIEQYNEVYGKIVNKEIQINDETIAEEASDIKTEVVLLNVQ